MGRCPAGADYSRDSGPVCNDLADVLVSGAMSRTRRQHLVDRLSRGPSTVHELAAELGVQIKTIVEDLEHVRRSLRDRKLVMVPARCLSCGFVFSKRERFTAPSRCPECRSEHTDEPELSIA